MATIVQLDKYRKAHRPQRPAPASQLSGSPHYFCLRCDAERFQLYATGVIHCAQCGALMRNISVIEGEEGRAGSK
ncbi:MAG TPA: hypothetical protein VNH12_07705 [Burkholderiales bacterium]|nr:hypothetical protein [Burkholderiales bacterium]